MSEHRYEPQDLADDRRGIAIAVGVVGTLLIAGLVVAGVASRMFGGEPTEGIEGAIPTDVLRELRETVDAEWSARAIAWEWTDASHSVARIPVARAVELSLARGFPGPRQLPRPVTARGLP